LRQAHRYLAADSGRGAGDQDGASVRCIHRPPSKPTR
jgi:hypothetical protein